MCPKTKENPHLGKKYAAREIKINAPESVYSPNEDSALLANAAIENCSGKVLEIGCGSGFVCISLADAKPDAKIFACDINSKAVECAKENAAENGVKVEFSESNLFSNIKEKGFDWIIFNPPYLPTEKAERMEGGLNFAFDGGKSGHDTAFRFLEQVGKYLKKDGKVLLVASTAANLAELNDKINGLEYKFEIIAQQSFFFEKIYVYRIYRKKS